MRWTPTNVAKALLLLLFLAGCTTAPVNGAKDIGYENIGSSGPNRLYVCTGGNCGEVSVVVHRTASLSQSESSELAALVNSSAGRKLLLRELSGIAKRKDSEISFGGVSKTSIAGRSAVQLGMNFTSNGKRDGAGHVILLVDNGKMQIFAAVSETAPRARAQVRRFAQKWAAGSK
jgi:hypothetical protein